MLCSRITIALEIIVEKVPLAPSTITLSARMYSLSCGVLFAVLTKPNVYLEMTLGSGTACERYSDCSVHFVVSQSTRCFHFRRIQQADKVYVTIVNIAFSPHRPPLLFSHQNCGVFASDAVYRNSLSARRFDLVSPFRSFSLLFRLPGWLVQSLVATSFRCPGAQQIQSSSWISSPCIDARPRIWVVLTKVATNLVYERCNFFCRYSEPRFPRLPCCQPDKRKHAASIKH